MKLKKSKSLTFKFLLNTLLTLFIYSLIYFGTIFLLYKIFTINVWDKKDLIYIIYLKFKEYIFPVWILGILIIIILYWRKTFIYINEIFVETSKLNDNDNNYIKLPSELYQIEESVNSIKEESIKQKQNAVLEEHKKNELISYLAHDLKTPLTSIIGYLDLLEKDENIDENQRKKYLKIIIDKTMSLDSLIDELFELTKLSNNTKVDIQKLDINLLIHQIIDDFYPTLKKLNKSIIVNNNNPIYIMCDSQKIYRAFNNLIKNAIYYSFDNSTINVNFKMLNGNIIITISNPCKHISESELKKIFEKFYRGDESRNSAFGGNGLGLAIAKEIIELHGGKINVKSNNDNIEFEIELKILRKS